MKELSIQEKAERYDKAIEIARYYYNDRAMPIGTNFKIERMFPELIENEDEKIRKWLIAQLELKSDANNSRELELMILKSIAWLEKQKKCSGENEEKIDRAIWLIEHYSTHGHDKELREGVISGLESLKRK